MFNGVFTNSDLLAALLRGTRLEFRHFVSYSLSLLSHLIPTTTLRETLYSHFTYVETETQRFGI